MAMCILLTPDEAAYVRGPSATTPGSALEPILRAGDVYILGVEVLTDPAHAEYHDFLAALPEMDSDDPLFPPPVGDP